MATATRPRQIPGPRYAPQIVNPLARLRRAIRFYVLIEALALCVTLACLWFWGTFLIDYGLFIMPGVRFDYLRDGPVGIQWVLRGLFWLALIGGLAIVLGSKVIYRLVASFRESALALVLERRFADLLGDRLVTAVELADPSLSRQYGYSQVMVDQTVRAAAERVQRLHVRDVFNWGRLFRGCLLAFFLLVSVGVFAVLFTDTAAIWLEREVLFQNTYWPRSTILVLDEFGSGPNGPKSKAVPYGAKTKLSMHAWKWVVATQDREPWPEGWRPLVWSDLWAEGRPWELEQSCIAKEYYNALPANWKSDEKSATSRKSLALDQVEVRLVAAHGAVKSIDEGVTPTPEGQRYLSELAGAVLNSTEAGIQKARDEGRSQLDETTLSLLPEEWRGLRLDTLEEHVRAARLLDTAELKRLADRLHGRELLHDDHEQWLIALFSPIKPVTLRASDLQHVPGAPVLTLNDSDWAPGGPLPSDWRDKSTEELQAALEEYREEKLMKRLAGPFMDRLAGLFTELQARADQWHIGKRRWFRQLDVPEEVTLEFETVLTEEEKRTLGKAKRAEPKIRRAPASYDFTYEFKRVEKPMRFRVSAGTTTTEWYRIDIVPIPVISKLERYQEEPGYLYGSIAPVQTGPLLVSTDGEESRFDARTGSRVRLEAKSSKPLTEVRVKVQGEVDQNLWPGHAAYEVVSAAQPQIMPGLGVPLDVLGNWLITSYVENRNPYLQGIEHQPGSDTFRFALKEVAYEDLKLQIEFKDTDGLMGSRKLVITALRDQGPEFVHARFDIVHREFITDRAVIPFSGRIRDEHGLREIYYEVRVTHQPEEGKIVQIGPTQRFPLRQFAPLRVWNTPLKDLPFEGLGQTATGRLTPGQRSLRMLDQLALSQFPSMLNQLPFGGALAIHQAPSIELPEEHRFEYALRPVGEKAYRPELDEYLDTLLLRHALQEINPDAPMLAPPYRVSVSLVARDNFVGTDDQGKPVDGIESRSPETFEFNVADVQDLLIDIGKREEELHDKLETVIAKLKTKRGGLKTMRDTFDMFKGDEPLVCDDLVRTIEEGRDTTDREVAREFRLIYREMELNRCEDYEASKEMFKRIDDKICRPLEDALAPLGHPRFQGQHFERAIEQVRGLSARITKDREKTPSSEIDRALRETDLLIAHLDEILTQIQRLMDFSQSLELLKKTIKAEEEAKRKTENRIKLLQWIETVNFKGVDKDGNGVWTPDELKGTPGEIYFGDFDGNRDGKVEEKEFLAFVKKIAGK